MRTGTVPPVAENASRPLQPALCVNVTAMALLVESFDTVIVIGPLWVSIATSPKSIVVGSTVIAADASRVDHPSIPRPTTNRTARRARRM